MDSVAVVQNKNLQKITMEGVRIERMNSNIIWVSYLMGPKK